MSSEAATSGSRNAGGADDTRPDGAYRPQEISKRTAILLIHGAEDDHVAVSNSLTMAGHFARLGRRFSLIVPERGSHTLIEHQKRVRAEMDRWVDAELED